MTAMDEDHDKDCENDSVDSSHLQIGEATTSAMDARSDHDYARNTGPVDSSQQQIVETTSFSDCEPCTCQRTKDLELTLRDMENKNKALTAEKNRCAKKLKKLSKELEELKSSLSIFNDDQWKALSSKSMRGYYWSDETVTKALQLRFACGSSGYDMLISQGFPLPNNRTLQRRMQRQIKSKNDPRFS